MRLSDGSKLNVKTLLTFYTPTNTVKVELTYPEKMMLVNQLAAGRSLNTFNGDGSKFDLELIPTGMSLKISLDEDTTEIILLGTERVELSEAIKQ